MSHAVLCVDDEPHILAGLERNLRKVCPLETAVGGRAALDVLRRRRDFAVIISDMRMPEMDGASFLDQARLLVPDAIRIVLTGEADLGAVVAAINRGHLHHYLRKPVERSDLEALMERCFVEYDARLESRAAVLSSLGAATRVVTAALEARHPLAAAHADRVAVLATRLAEAFGLASLGVIEIVARLFALSRLQRSPALDRAIDDMLAHHDELESARQALRELRLKAANPSVMARLSLAACLIDELDQGGGSEETNALLEDLVEPRVLDAARAMRQAA
ncbi:MAG: response regulator [Myxococcaceae bacterium]|jgi:response regulator RpfG family c-di-GMP phosphodiesterase|nr:response regulator [Myxococcaceae bacterium]